MGNKPKISIVIPTYNREKIIGRTLDCIVAQTFTDWECFVVDDFSSDNTKDLIDCYVQKDCRFHYMLNERKKGAQGARNTGLYHSNADWVWFMDSDDIVHNDFLEKMCGAIAENVDVVTCYNNIIDNDSLSVKRTCKWNLDGNMHEQLLAWKCYVYFQSSIVRKSKILEIGGVDECCPAHQEYDTHIMLSKIANYTTVRDALFEYYVGGKDTISVNYERSMAGWMYLLSKHKKDWLDNRSAGTKMYSKVWGNVTWSYTSRWKKLCAYMKLFVISPRLFFLSRNKVEI